MGTLLIQSTRMSRPTAFAVVAIAAAGAQLVAAQAGFSSLPYPGITPFNHTCSLDTVYSSCPEQNYTSVDSCCTETFGGLVIATQFWDTYTGLESEGQLLPKEAWTLHGLWPDFCNGSYTGYCDVSRQYDPEPSPNVSSTGVELQPYTGNVTMTGVLQKFGRLDLLAYMEKYWVSQGSSSESFWAHEVSKHATCYSNYTSSRLPSTPTRCTRPTSGSPLLASLRPTRRRTLSARSKTHSPRPQERSHISAALVLGTIPPLQATAPPTPAGPSSPNCGTTTTPSAESTT